MQKILNKCIYQSANAPRVPQFRKCKKKSQLWLYQFASKDNGQYWRSRSFQSTQQWLTDHLPQHTSKLGNIITIDWRYTLRHWISPNKISQCILLVLLLTGAESLPVVCGADMLPWRRPERAAVHDVHVHAQFHLAPPFTISTAVFSREEITRPVDTEEVIAGLVNCELDPLALTHTIPVICKLYCAPN